MLGILALLGDTRPLTPELTVHPTSTARTDPAMEKRDTTTTTPRSTGTVMAISTSIPRKGLHISKCTMTTNKCRVKLAQIYWPLCQYFEGETCLPCHPSSCIGHDGINVESDEEQWCLGLEIQMFRGRWWFLHSKVAAPPLWKDWKQGACGRVLKSGWKGLIVALRRYTSLIRFW